jgi:hypothetical protein
MSNKVNHDSCRSGQLEVCHSGAFKRLNYFHGMLLTEQDFVDEQTYIREKLKLHNRMYSAGVVWGLCLFKGCIKVDDGNITKFFVKAGLALDCAGNEIVVCEDYLVPLDEKIEELCRLGQLKKVGDTLTGPRLYVGIRYCECKSDPVEQYTSECADDRLRPQFSRVREGFNIQLYTEKELPCCEDHKEKDRSGCLHACSECGGLHPCDEDEQLIILGYIEDYSADGRHPEKRDHKNAKSIPLEDWPTTPTGAGGLRPKESGWEAQKHRMLRGIFYEAHWIDVSGLIGMKKEKIDDWLNEKHLKRGQTYKTKTIPSVQKFVERVNQAQHWAAQESVIDIITDDEGTCVIFFLINPPLAAA